jgi:RNase P protein component
VREAYRQVRAQIAGNVELVVIARPIAARRPFPELVEDMRRLAETLARAARAAEADA